MAKKIVYLRCSTKSALYMRRITPLILFVFACLSVGAQKIVISGAVTDERTGKVISQASVGVTGERVGVVTNDEGYFTLKVEEIPPSLVVSHLGYETKRVPLSGNASEALAIRLKPTSIELGEVVVWTENPRDLVSLAISKIPDNYSKSPTLYKCFYREAAMKRKHFIYVAEGVVNMYKTSYKTPGASRDRVAIEKGRRLLSVKQSDTLGVKVSGGPVQPLIFDIVKNPDFLLNQDDMAHYDFTMEGSAMIDDRAQYVVGISPREYTPWALYYGKLYIDRATLSFSRAELSLDVHDVPRATRYMLISKPAGVRFKAKELSILVDYQYEDGVTYINYVRSLFRFNCDWKRKLLSTGFSVACEMVVTDRVDDGAVPIRGRDSFDSHSAFYDKVDYFLDPLFWEDYNIIEPTESLDKAIEKIIKKY